MNVLIECPTMAIPRSSSGGGLGGPGQEYNQVDKQRQARRPHVPSEHRFGPYQGGAHSVMDHRLGAQCTLESLVGLLEYVRGLDPSPFN